MLNKKKPGSERQISSVFSHMQNLDFFFLRRPESRVSLYLRRGRGLGDGRGKVCVCEYDQSTLYMYENVSMKPTILPN
jgi:hypothetical protein